MLLWDSFLCHSKLFWVMRYLVWRLFLERNALITSWILFVHHQICHLWIKFIQPSTWVIWLSWRSLSRLILLRSSSESFNIAFLILGKNHETQAVMPFMLSQGMTGWIWKHILHWEKYLFCSFPHPHPFWPPEELVIQMKTMAHYYSWHSSYFHENQDNGSNGLLLG